MTNFFNIVKDRMQLSENSRQAFLSVMKKEEYEKGHVLVRPGSICRSIYFVEKGLTRTFYEKDDKDLTDWLSPENTIACSIVSFAHQQPDRRGLELLEDSTLWILDYDDMEMLCEQHHEIEKFMRMITSYGMLLVQERYDDLHFSSAAERYKKLMEYQPTLIQRAPLGMIASYLGVTQETLSRIRSKHAF
jgi:CRP-like cAMP-binding protein